MPSADGEKEAELVRLHTVGTNPRVGEIEPRRRTSASIRSKFPRIVERKPIRFVFRGSRDEDGQEPRPSNPSRHIESRGIPAS